MIMRARQDGNVLIVELEGQLDFETTNRLHDTFTTLVTKSAAERVIFNMEKLKFVGSSGINQFVKIMKSFNSSPAKPKLCQVSSEFTKIFRALQTARHPFEIYENELQAIDAFNNPPPPVEKKRRKKSAVGQA